MLTLMRSTCLALLASLMTAAVHAAPGDLDPAFGNAGQLEIAPGWYFEATPDGRILQWQGNSGASGVMLRLRRYLANGQLDTTWGAGGEVSLDPAPFLAAQGKSSCTSLTQSIIQAAGNGTTGALLSFVSSGAAVTCRAMLVVKLRATGSPDPSFGSAGYVDLSSVPDGPTYSDTIGPQDDGSVMVGETWYDDYGVVLNALWRIGPDGSISPPRSRNASYGYFFDGHTAKFRRLPDGKLVVAGGDGIRRLDSDGTPDAAYGNAGTVSLDISAPGLPSALATAAGITGTLRILGVGDGVIAADGSVVISLVAESGTTARMMLARISSAGQLDTSFGTGGVAVIDTAGAPWVNLAFGSGSVNRLVVSTTGELTVQGYVASSETAARHVAYGFLWRRTPQGQAPATPALGGIQLLDETPLWGCCSNGTTLRAAQSGYDVLLTNLSASAIFRLGTNVGASAGLVTLSSNVTVDEGAIARLAAWRVAGSTGAVSLSYSTSSAGVNPPATAGSDYVTASGRIDWADGESGVRYIDITTLANPQRASDAGLLVNVAKVSGGALLVNDAASAVNIHNTAPLPPVTPSPPSPPSTPVSGGTSSSTSGGGAVGGWMLALLLGLALARRGFNRGPCPASGAAPPHPRGRPQPGNSRAACRSA